MVSSGCCEGCVATSVSFLPLEDKHSLMCVVLDVDMARFQNRLGRWRSELHTSRPPRVFAKLRHATTSCHQGCARALRIRTTLQFDRRDMARQIMAFRLEKTSRTGDAAQRVVARQNTKSAANRCQVRLIQRGKLDNM